MISIKLFLHAALLLNSTKGDKSPSQWHEVYCHDLAVVSSNPGRVELGVRSTFVPSRTWTKHKNDFLNQHAAELMVLSGL